MRDAGGQLAFFGKRAQQLVIAFPAPLGRQDKARFRAREGITRGDQSDGMACASPVSR